MRPMNRVYLELGPKKVFACSVDWPGWCRIGTSEEHALDTLMDYVPRYAVVATRAGVAFDPGEPVVVERVPGSQMTDFGAPYAVPELDGQPLEEPERGVALLRATWDLFDEVAAAAPAELRKGPRGGGRDRDKIVDHVTEAERSYARKLGVRHKPYKSRADRDAMRDELVAALLDPPAESGWPVPYALRRTAWHVLDHVWEIEDKSG
ncbi:MAG: hypothetical protein HOY71_20145 [Nonomuraea sp.]|nr:hypothetical protein [Nonomuraea sp.]